MVITSSLVGLETLNKFISTSFISRDSIDANWMSRYNELVDFHNTTGHALVSRGNKEHVVLANWCQRQRKSLKEGKLCSSKIDLLNQLKFMWCPLESRWQSRFKELKAYYEENGHVNIPSNDEELVVLCKWLFEQKKMARSGRLLPHRKQALSKFVDDFSPGENRWMAQYKAVRRHFRKNGNIIMTPSTPMGIWIYKQMLRYKNKKLPEERLEKLNKIGFQNYLKNYHSESSAA